jgi:hypothetical protein
MRGTTGGASSTVVIARLDRAIQYSAAVAINQKGRGVLDHPLSRVMTSCWWGARKREHGIQGFPDVQLHI